MKVFSNVLNRIGTGFKNFFGMIQQSDRKVVLLIIFAAVLYFILTPKWEVIVLKKGPSARAINDVMPNPAQAPAYAPGVPGSPGQYQPPAPVPSFPQAPGYPQVGPDDMPGVSQFIVIRLNKFSGAVYAWNEAKGWVLLEKPRKRRWSLNLTYGL